MTVPSDDASTDSSICVHHWLLGSPVGPTTVGLCRDWGASRFVSGYLAMPAGSAHGYVGGGSTHAWVQVYPPSAGWIEFDPTNGSVGTRDLIRVAVARDPRQAVPLHGLYLGAADAYLAMDVDIKVVLVGESAAERETA